MDPNYRKFPYKYKAYANVKQEIIQRFNKLKKFNYEDRLLLDRVYTLRGMEKLEPNDLLFTRNPTKEKGRYTVLLTRDTDYNDFNVLSDFFNENCRMKCILTGRNISPYSFWHKNYKKIRKYALEKYKVINYETLRESLYHTFFGGKGECTSFRPNIMVAMMQLFNAKIVLDSSAGWGDRLIGALAGGCEKYVAVDPNPCVNKGYDKIIKFFGAENRAKVYQMGFEDFENPDGLSFEILHSSPPYFKMEEYTSDENQSIIKYPSEDMWFEKFLKVLLNKAILYVKKNGIIALNIGMMGKDTYVYKMLEYMNNDKKDQVIYLGIISYSDPNFKSVNPIFIWCKK